MNLQQLNDAPPDDAAEALRRCCASRNWAATMVGSRPFADAADLAARAAAAFATLREDDWLEAFDGHPKIGDMASLKAKYGATKTWSAGEQSGAADASMELLTELAEANTAYHEKFGFIFIICATGRTAREMLTHLRERLPNDRSREMVIAAGEQMKITQLRLEKLIA